MPKGKYRYNKEQLRFTEVRVTLGMRIWRVIRYLLAAFAIAVIAFFIFSLFFETLFEQQMRKENAQLRASLDTLVERYEQVERVVEDIEQRDYHIYRMLFENDPVVSEEEQAARMMHDMYEMVEKQGMRKVSELNCRILRELRERMDKDKSRFDDLVHLVQSNPELMESIPSIHPIEDTRFQTISAPFGVRIHPFYKVLKMHEGVDYPANAGTAVRATAAGKVVSVMRSQRGWGNSIRIRHGNGYETVYSHLEKIAVRRNQRVERGEQIATTGNSGMSMAPHLHYEVRLQGKAVDPLHYLFMEYDPLELAAVARRASQAGQSLD